MEYQYAVGSPTITLPELRVDLNVMYDDRGDPWNVVVPPGSAYFNGENEVSNLCNEAFKHVKNVHYRAELKLLCERHFSDDLSEMLPAFTNGENNKEVSTRTLQSWTAPIELASSRTCPAWSVEAVRAYIERNPMLVKHHGKRGFGVGKSGYAWRKDNQLLKDAESHAAAERVLRDRIAYCPAPLLSQRLADEIIELRRANEMLMREISSLHFALNEMKGDPLIGKLLAKWQLKGLDEGLYAVEVQKAAQSKPKPDSDLD